MKPQELALRLAAWLEHAAAAGFLVLVVIGLTLWLAKTVDRRHAAAIWDVLRDEKVVVSRADSIRWAGMDKDAAAKTDVETEEQKAGKQANNAWQQQKERLQAEFDKERAQLQQYEKLIAEREVRLSDRQKRLATDLAQFSKAREEYLEQKQKGNLQKVLKLYAGMAAEDIAKDFLAKLQTNKQEDLDEVVEILRSMQERQASEVLSAIPEKDASVRVKLFAAIRSKT